MNYYNHYFKTNWDIIKNTWKGTKSILNINNSQSNTPKILIPIDTTSTEPIEIANIIDNFFTSIATLKNRSDDFFFVSPNKKCEIINLICSLDSNKSTAPNSICTKILKLLKNDIFLLNFFFFNFDLTL